MCAAYVTYITCNFNNYLFILRSASWMHGTGPMQFPAGNCIYIRILSYERYPLKAISLNMMRFAMEQIKADIFAFTFACSSLALLCFPREDSN